MGSKMIHALAGVAMAVTVQAAVAQAPAMPAGAPDLNALINAARGCETSVQRISDLIGRAGGSPLLQRLLTLEFNGTAHSGNDLQLMQGIRNSGRDCAVALQGYQRHLEQAQATQGQPIPADVQARRQSLDTAMEALGKAVESAVTKVPELGGLLHRAMQGN